MRRMAPWAAALAAALLNLAGSCDGSVNNGTVQVAPTVRVSVGTSGQEGNGPSTFMAVSRQGRFIAFTSQASNLHPDDPDPILDVYVHDLATRTTELISRATGPAGVKANGDCERIAISSDGRFVAFGSTADNLDPDDLDTTTDIYVRDRITQTTALVSRNSAGIKANGFTSYPSLSDDGSFIAFESNATNLDADDPDVGTDIFRRHLPSGTTILISRATDGMTPGVKGNGDSRHPSISSDGTAVAFSSKSDNLHADDGDTNGDIYVRVVPLGFLILASRATGVAGAKSAFGECQLPSLSGNGQHVAFHAEADNLAAPEIDSNGVKDVFVRDLVAFTTERVSLTDGDTEAFGGLQGSQFASISAGGRFVAFYSEASNLVPGDSNMAADVFVRDRATGRTVRASVRTYGGEGNSDSVFPVLPDAGNFVAFFSFASNLVDQDNNGSLDVFIRQLIW